jgi:hypothetical protein
MKIRMKRQFLLIVSALSYCLAYIGKCAIQRAKNFIPIKVYNFDDQKQFGASSLKMSPRDEDKAANLKREAESQFSDRISSFTSDREFAVYLKSVAQKRITLSRTDRRQLADELTRRVPLMSVHSISKVLWSMGTLKLPTKITVQSITSPKYAGTNNTAPNSNFLLLTFETS